MTSKVYVGGKVATLPTIPDVYSCNEKVFVGWSNQEVTDGNKPSVLFTAAADAPTIEAEGDVTYYAVFAKAEEGSGEEETLSFTYASHEGWTITNCSDKSSASCFVINNDGSIVSPVFDVSDIQSIVGKVRTYGGTQYNNITIKCGNDVVGTITPEDGTLADATAVLVDPLSLSGQKSLTFTSTTTTTSNGPGISSITITYNASGTISSEYETSCTTATLVSIAITGTPKLDYAEGETFSTAGLKVMGTYSDASEVEIKTGIEWTIDPDGALTTSDKSVDVMASVQDILSDVETYDITVTAPTYYSVSWMVNGEAYTAGDPSTSVIENQKVSKLPTAPTSCDPDNIAFMGWTNTTLSKQATAPDVLFNTAAESPDVTEDVTYYAVWADAEEKQASYSKATTLNNNDKVIWATESEGAPSVGVTGANTTTNKDATVSETAAEWMEFTVVKDGSTYKFKNGSDFITAASKEFKFTSTGTALTLNSNAQAIWTSGSDTYALLNNDTYYRFYKTTNTSYTKYFVWKYSAGGTEYSNYTTTCQTKVTIADPEFSVVAGSYTEVQSVELTCATPSTTIYYTTDNTDPKTSDTKSAYQSTPIAVNSSLTIRAIATDGNDNWSNEVSAAYVINIFSSLQDLADAELNSGTDVKVSFEGQPIKSIFVTQSGDRNGIFFDIQKGDNDIEIYYVEDGGVPASWVAEGTVSGTITGTWKSYKGTWELCPPANEWSWNNLTYQAPQGTTAVVISGTPTHTTYVEGAKFNPDGLTVTATISGVETPVTEGITWITDPSPIALGTPSLSVTATYNEVTSDPIVYGITVTAIAEQTIANFITNQGGRCYLIGEVSDLNGDKFTLTDASGNIQVYQFTLGTGVSALADGDYIKVIAEDYLSYYGTDRAKDVQVIEKLEKPVVPVTSVELTTTEASIKIGKTTTIGVTILPAIATTKTYTYSILAGGESVISVEDGTGENEILITALAEGTATVKVVSDADDTKYATCAVTVTTSGLPEFDKGDWVKVTNLSELTAGSYVIVAAAASDVAMKSISDQTYKLHKSAEKIGDQLTYDADFGVYEIQEYEESSEVVGVALFNVSSEKYLNSTANGKLAEVATLATNASWTLNIANNVTTVTNRSISGGKIQYNSGSPRFAVYTSNQGAIDLYKYYVKANKIIYDANGGTNAPASSRANELGVATVTSSVPTYGGYNFVNWTANQDGTGKVYTAGEEVNLTEDITIYAQWEKKPIEGTPSAIVFKHGDNYYAMDKDLTPYSVTVVNGKLLNITEAKKEDLTWYRQTTDGGVYLVNSAEQYLSGNTSNTTLTVGATPCVWAWDSENNCYSIGNRSFFYQKSANAIKNYAKSNLGNSDYSGVAMFINEYLDAEVYNRDITEGNFGTICLPKAVDEGNYSGAIFYELTYKENDGSAVVGYSVTNLEAGMPYIFLAMSNQMVAYMIGDAQPAGNHNGLHGVLDEKLEFTALQTNCYIVKNNALLQVADGTSSGYWVDPNRAYVKLDEVKTKTQWESENGPAQVAGRKRMSIGGHGVATGIDGIQGNAEVQKVMIDGVLYIVRDGKAYSITGGLIK